MTAVGSVSLIAVAVTALIAVTASLHLLACTQIFCKLILSASS